MAHIKKRIGEIFIENGIISERTMLRALEKAAVEKVRLGNMLEEMGVVTSVELAAALACQFGCRTVENLDKHTFSAELLAMIPADTALRFLIFPLGLENGVLFLAVSDPTETRAAASLAETHGVRVVRMLATRAEIICGINKHYLGKEKMPARGRTVLVADDSPPICAEIKEILERARCQVVVANDGIQAFKMALLDAPQVIIADKEMPKFGGYRLLESLKVRPETKDVPVIMLTGSTDSEEEENALNMGFFDFIQKPVREVTLVARVNRALQVYEGTQRYR
jgi:CheY-like chemotaxis protein